jgi:membrane dipeptidase
LAVNGSAWLYQNLCCPKLAEHLHQQAAYIGGLCGWSSIGIGPDLDGGFGLEESPLEIDTVADLDKIGPVLPEEFREGVLSSNWLNFLRRALPQSVN